MIYVWECESCKKQVEVNRPLKDIEIGPDEPCCGPYKRVITWKKEQTQLVHGGRVPWHNEEYTRTRSIK